ncbi:MAG: hypothetical protein QXH07_01245 [Thermoplasmata archaeon]
MTLKSITNKVMDGFFMAIQRLVKNKFNLKALKNMYNAHGNSVITVRIYYDHYFSDLIYERNFRIGEDTIEIVENPKQIDGLVETDYQTIINISKGEIRREYRGKIEIKPYTITDAYSEGRLIIIGVGMSNYLGDLAVFREIYNTALPDLRNYVNERV